MARQARLRLLREALQKALLKASRPEPTAADWRPLAQAEAALAQALPAMAREGAWSSAERQELALLREAHAQAEQRCHRALDTLGAHLHELAHHKEGWLAYAHMNASQEDI